LAYLIPLTASAYNEKYKNPSHTEKTNIWVREKTKITDAIDRVRSRKWT